MTVSFSYAEAPLAVRQATFLGSGGDDELNAAAFDKKGRLYVVGQFGAAYDASGFPNRATLGNADSESTYGFAFVACFDPEGKPLAIMQLAKGVGVLTDIAVNDAGIYVAGYATRAAESLLNASTSLSAKAAARPTFATYTPKEHYDEPKFAPGFDQRGQPIVLRIDPELSRVTGGTYLEGWQSVWHVPEPLKEDWREPTLIGLLSNGDLIVSHDGGYNRIPENGAAATLEDFYHVPNHLSRLSADLSMRKWKQDIYLTRTHPQIVSKGLKMEWKHDTLGNPRPMRLRVDASDHFYLSGWAAAQTSSEPWWSSFLRKYDADGKHVWSAYEHAPTAGDGRMNGLVSDSCVRSVNIAPDGTILVAAMSDGGNTILRRDPRDLTQDVGQRVRGSAHSLNGRTLFVGLVATLNPDDADLIVADTLGGYAKQDGKKLRYTPAWANDIASFGGGVLIAGRCGLSFPVTDDAWLKPPAEPYTRRGEYGMVRLYDASLKLRFSAALPPSNPDAIAVSADGKRAAIMGTTASDTFPVRQPMQSQCAGGRDGFIMIVETTGNSADAPATPELEKQ